MGFLENALAAKVLSTLCTRRNASLIAGAEDLAIVACGVPSLCDVCPEGFNRPRLTVDADGSIICPYSCRLARRESATEGLAQDAVTAALLES